MFKKLKSLFIEENEGAKTPEEATPAQEEMVSSKVQNTDSQSITRSVSAGEGKVTEKFTNILLGVLDKNNIEGFDYLEFKKSLRSLSKMPMDEATRFKSAFAMAQTMGTTPQKLIDTAQFYLNVLQKEEKKFIQVMSSQRTKQIGNKEQNLKKLEEVIQQKTKQIQQLTQEIESHKKQMEQMRQEISSSSVKVEATKANFDATYDVLVSQIRQDMENIKKYLK